jgi:hypothetical protein
MKRKKLLLSLLVLSIVILNTVVLSTSENGFTDLSSFKIAYADGEGSDGDKIKRTTTTGTSTSTSTKSCPGESDVICTTTYTSYRITCDPNGNQSCTPDTGKNANVFCPDCE